MLAPTPMPPCAPPYHRILQVIPDWLASYASELFGNTILNGKSHTMSDITQLLSEEANRVKAHNADKEQPPVKSKRAAQTERDEVLVATKLLRRWKHKAPQGQVQPLWQGMSLGVRILHQEKGGSRISSSKLERAGSTGQLGLQAREQACRIRQRRIPRRLGRRRFLGSRRGSISRVPQPR